MTTDLHTRWLKKFIRKAREIKLTAHEKRAMLSTIIGESNIPSPYSFFLTVMDHRMKFATIAIMAVFVLTSGGTSFAAGSSLPGDVLYPIKVNVNESIETFVAVSTVAKAKIGIKHTQNRLLEAETLSKSGKLDAKKQAIIETKIEEHTTELKLNIAVLASENATNTVKEVISDLRVSIEEHEAVLSTIASSTQIDALIEKVNEVKIEMEDIGKKVEENNATSTPKQATTTASDIIDAWTSSSSESQVILPNASSSQR